MNQIFTINLAETESEGDFLCPLCKQLISPDDESGLIYDIMGVEEAEGFLRKVVIECRKCGSAINLEGFEELKKASHLIGLFDTSDYLVIYYPITICF